MIEKAAKAEPEDGYITDSLGWVLYRLGRYQDAVQPMLRAVELTPDDPIINDHLGDVLWMVGRKREAEFQWRRALSLRAGRRPRHGPHPQEARRRARQGARDRATSRTVEPAAAGDRELAPAKVNLALHVTGRRADGYHLLDSLVVFPRARRPPRGRAGRRPLARHRRRLRPRPRRRRRTTSCSAPRWRCAVPATAPRCA